MDYEQLQQYQQSLLNRALTEGIRRNDEQTKTWLDYKERHEKVIESVETFRQDLTVSCMVPLGTKALMRGKLTHTNEILVSLGEGYLVKYSAAQAVALCNRRIKRASDILENLEKERNLFTTRQHIPINFDAFGSEERKDLVEHWDNEKLDDWRIQHRQKEKEYRKKLADLRKTEKPEIRSEDDLFNKLDALELQEELEDELHRLEAARPDFYTQDLGDGEVYEESDSDVGSDTSDTTDDESTSCSEETRISAVNTSQTMSVNQINSSKSISGLDSTQQINENENPEDSSDTTLKLTKSEARGKKVLFGKPRVKLFNNTDKPEAITQDCNAAETEPSGQSRPREIKTSDDDESEDDEVIRIEFKHSDHEPEVPKVESESIESPRDIYRILSRPKSILKKSPNDVPQYDNYVPPVDQSTDEEIQDVPAGVSAYSTVVKEIRERVVDVAVGKPIEPVQQKRPISKFKRERANIK